MKNKKIFNIALAIFVLAVGAIAIVVSGIISDNRPELPPQSSTQYVVDKVMQNNQDVTSSSDLAESELIISKIINNNYEIVEGDCDVCILTISNDRKFYNYEEKFNKLILTELTDDDNQNTDVASIELIRDSEGVYTLNHDDSIIYFKDFEKKNAELQDKEYADLENKKENDTEEE